MGCDVKPLEVTNYERLDSTVYKVSDDVIEDDSKFVYKFEVKDLNNIQYGSQINVASTIVLGNDEDNTKEYYTYSEQLDVQSASSEHNTLTVNIDKEIGLNVTDISVYTQYNVIKFFNGKWELNLANRNYIDELCSDYVNVKRIKITDAAYSDSTVFYYENECWNTIELDGGDNLEDCLKDGKICFNSFKKYNNIGYNAVELDKNNLYYTAETYIELALNPSHYFYMPIEKVEDYTEYDRAIVSDITYPIVYFYLTSPTDNSLIKVKKEGHILSNSSLVFNYDSLTKVFTSDEIVDENIYEEKPTYPIVEYTEENIGTAEKMFLDASVETKYRRLTADEVTAFDDALFPYGFIIEEVNEFGDSCSLDDEDICDNVDLQYGVVGNVIVKRDTFLFRDDVQFTLSYDNSSTSIQIPISQQFETDLFHNDALQTNFVDHAKSDAINPINDMEKNVYTPAIQTSVDTENNDINAKYIDCYKIIFNLHFRKHRDKTKNGVKQEWVCDKDSTWNGNRIVEYTKDGKTYNILDFNGRVYNFEDTGDDKGVKKTNKKDYFSYYATAPTNDNYDQDETYKVNDNETYKGYRKNRSEMTEYQSDLLSYLGFSNDDIKYQKSKLKKTFLRISFYDSDNIGNQNLLHSSTIFLDSGDLFAKYIKNINTEEEYKEGNKIYDKYEYANMSIEEQKHCIPNGEPMAVIGSSFVEDDTTTSYDKNGVRVNREPMRKKVVTTDDLGDNIDDLERLRLSSQFVVTDKFSSKRSSEGFYFYTYKSNSNGVYPSEIYMRVDFNHAGYGRTIPFMMPYVTENESKDSKEDDRYHQKKKIKTLEDIAYDWSEVDLDNNFSVKDDDKIGYGSVKYIRYAYIKWKYRYDKDTQKHIYYLDPDIYGESVTSNNGHGHNIILNLYEGRIR